MKSSRKLAHFARLAAPLGVAAALVAGADGRASGADREARDKLEAVAEEEHALLDEVAAIEGMIAQLDAEIAEITRREQEVTTRLEAANARLAGAQQAEWRAEAHLEAQRARLRRHAVDVYVSGDRDEMANGELLALLAAEEPLDLNRIRLYGDSVVEYQSEVVNDFHTAEVAAASARRQATAERDAVQAERDALQVELDRRAVLRAEQEGAKARHQGLLVEVQVRRSRLEADVAAEAAESDAIGNEIRVAQAGQELALPMPGALVWPVAGQPTPVTSGFGLRFHPILNYERLHKGSDIDCDAGDALLAVLGGRIVIATVRGGYGNTVVIDHGGRLATLYAHASALRVAVGDVLEAGQPVADCGTTGLSTGPHLHFETRIEGGPVDPETFL